MIKIDIISGFLGAGKTTLIKKMLEQLKNERVVLVENEFGDVSVDSGFLGNSGIEIKEISSGCICCSLVGDFYESLKEIIEKYNPERIIIEPSGVGKLSDVIEAVKQVEELGAKINIITTVVDVMKVKMYSNNFGEFYNNQIENANTIIVSRTDKADENKIIDAVKLIKIKNNSANIITTQLDLLDSEKLIAVMEADYNLFSREVNETSHHNEGCCCGHHHEHEHSEECGCGHHHEHEHSEECGCGHHHADEVFTSYGVETVKKYSYELLDNILKQSSNDARIVRMKGIVASNIGNEWYHFDLVLGEYQIRNGNPDYIGKICVIATNISQNELESMFMDIN